LAFAGDPEKDVQTRALAFWLMNRYGAIQSAYDNGQVDRAFLDAYIVDFRRSIRFWPATASYMQEVIDSSPYSRAMEIFRPLWDGGTR
jgi:hypothetical protein